MSASTTTTDTGRPAVPAPRPVRWGEAGLTALWATHMIEEVQQDDRVLILHQGKLLADGSGQDICEAEGTRNLAETFHSLTGAG